MKNRTLRWLALAASVVACGAFAACSQLEEMKDASDENTTEAAARNGDSKAVFASDPPGFHLSMPETPQNRKRRC